MYTPKNIDDIVFKSEEEKARIDNILSKHKPFPAAGKNGILLFGTWGTGKTTLARMLPNLIEQTKGGEEANAEFIQCITGENGSALITKITHQASLVQNFNASGYHYFVLDEIDILTSTAMSSLKAAMNMPNTIFIMTTNYLNKIDKGVQNRSIIVDFNAAPSKAWLPLANKILTDNNVKNISDEKLLKIIDECGGSARSIIDAISSIKSSIISSSNVIRIDTRL
ncbi:AAA family ATPase [Methylophaga sp.]|uniref:AAA family ATPase n=1 Tax=Methylophaga sp. TaxID=2024840 RepID=UPI001400C12E|nr:AAA family ATPase [Methylophaga sp.]MTI64185.1 AAA family ATPase [Methylophaga sp.]